MHAFLLNTLVQLKKYSLYICWNSDDDDDDYEPPRPLSSAQPSQSRHGWSTQNASAPPHPQTLSSSETDSPEQSQPKRKGKSWKASAKRWQRASATVTMGEEGEGWHNREEKDRKPDPFRFVSARDPGPTFDTTAAWFPTSFLPFSTVFLVYL